jgi:hypothetical protein
MEARQVQPSGRQPAGRPPRPRRRPQRRRLAVVGPGSTRGACTTPGAPPSISAALSPWRFASASRCPLSEAPGQP